MGIMSEGVSTTYVCRSFEKVGLTVQCEIVELLSLEAFLKFVISEITPVLYSRII